MIIPKSQMSALETIKGGIFVFLGQHFKGDKSVPELARIFCQHSKIKTQLLHDFSSEDQSNIRYLL